MSTARAVLFRATSSVGLALAALGLLAPIASAEVAVSVSDRTLVVAGDEGAQTVAVGCGADGNVQVSGEAIEGGPVACDQVIRIDAAMGGGVDTVDFSGVGREFGQGPPGASAQMTSTDFATSAKIGRGTYLSTSLGDGDDRYVGSRTELNYASGDNGDDRISGGEAFEAIVGDAGEDILKGGGGGDLLRGYAGDDRIHGGGGRDSISGNLGNDRVFGGGGRDWISGEVGGDLLLGGAHNDVLSGGRGSDTLRGGGGCDQLFGGGGNDSVKGGPGEDTPTSTPPSFPSNTACPHVGR